MIRRPPRSTLFPYTTLFRSREAVGAVVVLRVRVTEFSGGGDQNVLAGLNVNARVQPELFAGDLDFLGNSLLSGRALWDGVLVLRCCLLRGRRALANELGKERKW